MAFSAAIACSARHSWTKPTIAWRTTMAKITAVSFRSPMTAVMAAAATRTRIMVLANCSASSRHAGLRAHSRSTLGPTRSKRSVASAAVRPTAESVASAAATASAGTAQ
jgi:hypothetical protein